MIAEKELKRLVGAGNVSDNAVILESYAGDMSFVNGVKPEYVVKVKNADEVQKLVALAKETGTPLVPISSGPPHFRGDTVPSVSGSIIVDLSRMNRIIKIDPKYKTAIVEPGVTFGQLQSELQKMGLCAYMPLLPRSSKSVIGSVLERDPVTIPGQHWDSTDPMLCIEIVFGTGDMARTGEAAGPDPLEKQWQIGKAQMSPFGPTQMDLQRLVSGAQGTIGIVTWMSLKCRFLPTLIRSLFISSENIEPLIDLSQKLVRPKLGEHLFILNGLNIAILLGCSREEIQRIWKLLPQWIMFIGFEGFGPLPEEKVKYQEADVRDLAKSFGLLPATNIQGINTERLQHLLSQPTEEEYWKLRLKGGFQDIFFLTTLDKAPGFVSEMRNLAQESGHPEDLGVYIQPVVQGTSCHCEFNLYYDPTDPVALDRTQELLKGAPQNLENRGGFFSRPYAAWAKVAYSRAEDTAVMQRKIKKIFDPNGILNPGKLCF